MEKPSLFGNPRRWIRLPAAVNCCLSGTRHPVLTVCPRVHIFCLSRLCWLHPSVCHLCLPENRCPKGGVEPARKTQLALFSSGDGKVDTRVITTSQVSPTFIVMPIIASNISLTIVIYKGLASVERFTNSPKWKLHYKTNMLMEIVLLQRHKNNAQKWPTNAFTVKLKD